jgi:hypothetical protein
MANTTNSNPPISAPTFAKALSASDSMAHLINRVRAGDSERAILYTEQIIHTLAKLLTDYGIELTEVLPLTTCTRCQRQCIEYRRFGDELVCVLCMADHVQSVLSPFDVLETQTRLREAVGILTDLTAPGARAAAFLEREAKAKVPR